MVASLSLVTALAVKVWPSTSCWPEATFSPTPGLVKAPISTRVQSTPPVKIGAVLANIVVEVTVPLSMSSNAPDTAEVLATWDSWNSIWLLPASCAAVNVWLAMILKVCGLVARSPCTSSTTVLPLISVTIMRTS